MYLRSFKDRIYHQSLSELPSSKILISCLNAYSFIIVQNDKLFQSALQNSQVILPDGIAIVFALNILAGIKLKKISGEMLFFHEMEQLNQTRGRCYFLGSSESTNSLIKMRVEKEYPNIMMDSYSPPFKIEFNEEDNLRMINAVNAFKPDVLFIGMTQPKQEKWAYQHFNELEAGHICCIGAVFDFYAGTVNRAPKWMIGLGLEWLHRLLKEPRRMWRRYLIGNSKFIWLVINEKFRS